LTPISFAFSAIYASVPYSAVAMSEAFQHEALLYAGEEEFLAGTVPFVRQGIEAGEPVMVAVSQRKIDLMRSELNGFADSVAFVEMTALGRNPGRIIPAWRDFVRDRGADDSPVRGIGEPVWPERTPDELVECRHHESLLNLAFADTPAFQLLCPYDAAGLGPDALETAWCTHPTVCGNGGAEPSSAYLDPHANGAPFTGELAAPPDTVREYFFSSDYLKDLRQIVLHRSEDAGLPSARADDLVLAVNEVATNSALHSDGHGRLRVWTEPGAFMCEVSDTGLIMDPLAGRHRPEPTQAYGRGLFIVNQVCDLVQIRSGDEGTVVRLRMSLD
jgi:anti-sigma regulatory factor (Ser/Thr protein kinase)